MADWSPLRTMLAAVDTSVTLTWKDLDRLVGGLPRSACEHNAFWKGERSGWPGFRTSAVKVGESVTFARVGAPQGTARLTPVTPVLPRAGAADLVLVGCVKQKLPVPAPAKDLYTSPLFRKSRAYAEQAGVPWFVLSAEHGLVTPEQRLAPYDLRLSKTPREYRRAWGARVVDRLQQEVGPLTGKTIEVHAGAAYVEPIRPLLTHAGATVVEPLAGLKLGPRLAWYGATAEANAEGMVTLEAAADVSELTNQLKESERAVSPEVFLATGGDDLRSPGLYSWWVDAAGAADLSRGLGVDVSPGLIYAGLAGATRSRSGRMSKNTLWGRIKTMHLGGRHEFSTFRLSLGSVLAEARGDHEIDEDTLTDWMHRHLRLIAVPIADADTLGEVETSVLSHLNPPLNLDKVQRDPLRARLSNSGRSTGGSNAPAQ